MYGMEIVYFVISTVVVCAIGGLLVKWSFGGKKENKKKNEKLFETTAFFGTKAPWGMIAPRDRSDIAPKDHPEGGN